MKLSELSSEQKSRWIAENLGWHYVNVKNEGKQTAWITGWVDPQNVFRGGLPDFVNDPAMTVMLMEQMAKPRSYGFMFKAVMECIYGFDTNTPDEPRLQRAVVDAFMLWKGWREDQES